MQKIQIEDMGCMGMLLFLMIVGLYSIASAIQSVAHSIDQLQTLIK